MILSRLRLLAHSDIRARFHVVSRFETARRIPLKFGRPLEACRPQVHAKFRPYRFNRSISTVPERSCLQSFQRAAGSRTPSCVVVRMPFANASIYPHEITQAKAAWCSFNKLQISSPSDEPFRNGIRRTEPSTGYSGPAVLVQSVCDSRRTVRLIYTTFGRNV